MRAIVIHAGSTAAGDVGGYYVVAAIVTLRGSPNVPYLSYIASPRALHTRIIYFNNEFDNDLEHACAHYPNYFQPWWPWN